MFFFLFYGGIYYFPRPRNDLPWDWPRCPTAKHMDDRPPVGCVIDIGSTLSLSSREQLTAQQSTSSSAQTGFDGSLFGAHPPQPLHTEDIEANRVSLCCCVQTITIRAELQTDCARYRCWYRSIVPNAATRAFGSVAAVARAVHQQPQSPCTVEQPHKTRI